MQCTQLVLPLGEQKLQCRQCHEEKPISSFGRFQKARRNCGRQYWCKECMHEYQKMIRSR